MPNVRSVEDGYEGDFRLGYHFGDADSRLLEASVDGQGGSIRGKPVFTIEQIKYQLNRGDGIIFDDAGKGYESGAVWSGAVGVTEERWYTLAKPKGHVEGTPLTELAFGFYESLATLPEPYVYKDEGGTTRVGFSVAQGFSALSETQRVAARDAIRQWDELISVKFVEKDAKDGDINFMNTTTGPAQASAYLPYDYGVSSAKNSEGKNVSFAEISGDIYIAPPSVNSSNALFDEGQYGLTTLIHEIGHSLGLEHPGAYNFGPGFSVTYANGAEYFQDSNQYSIMSYWDSEETGANHIDWNLLTYRYPSTAMVHDVAAIQALYGADMETRKTDTVYGFNSTAGNDSFDFNLTPLPVATIWDAGGNDTIDVSGFSTQSVVDLNPGAFSSVGGFFSETIPTLEEVNARRAAAGLAPRSQATYDLYLSLVKGSYNDGLMTDNLGIAYGATIENAIGGSGDDLFIANGVANKLTGGAGDDTVSYRAATGGVYASLAAGGGNGFAKGDSYVGIEGLEGSAFNDTLVGDAGANRLAGGAGDDKLSGAAGDDTLVGGLGLDTLGGGTGNDLLQGGADADTLNGDSGDDVLQGDDGADTLNGGTGNDQLIGGIGADLLSGGDGADTLRGGDGSDRLAGGAGVDRLYGDLGADILTGGSGNDLFYFTTTDKVTDTITDFVRGQDKIDLTGIDAIIATAGVEGFRYIGTGVFTGGRGGQVRFYNDGKDGYLAGDVDGDMVADFTIKIENVVRFGTADLILV